MFSEFTHESAVNLAEKLLSLLPQAFERVFYSDNGSTAVETALKIAFQYWYNENPKTKRKKVITFTNAYHGDTFGAMSVSEKALFTTPFLHALFDVHQIDPPTASNEEQTLEKLSSILNREDSACFIFEPQIQGVGGMMKHSIEALDKCIALCREAGVLTIADEVMTGLGRTGPNFAIERLNNTPDMICLAKGLTGGFLPLGATITTGDLYDRFLSTDRAKALLHGHSYTANPPSCAAALASLELLDSAECIAARAHIEARHKEFFDSVKEHPKLIRSHVSGTILALEYEDGKTGSYYNPLRDRLAAHFKRRNLLIRPFGSSIHIVPPYCIRDDQLDEIYAAIEETLEDDKW